jgi:hypothetical protein
MKVKSWFKFVTSAERLDGVVGEWGSADRSRSAELQFAASVVRLGPHSPATPQGGAGGSQKLIQTGLVHLVGRSLAQRVVWSPGVI